MYFPKNILLFLYFFWFWGECVAQEEVNQENCPGTLCFFGVSIELLNDCILKVASTSSVVKQPTIKVDLPYPETCEFVTLSDSTNIVRAEKYYDAWIVLVQSYRQVDKETCDTRYKAIIVRKDRKVFVSSKSNGGSGCPPIYRDRGAFTYLAHDYVNHD